MGSALPPVHSQGIGKVTPDSVPDEGTVPLPPLKDGAVPSQSTANALPCPYRPSMGAPGVAGEGHPTGNTESRKKLYLPRPPAASFSLLSSSNSMSPTHTLVSVSTRKSLLIHSIKELLPPALLLHPKHAPEGTSMQELLSPALLQHPERTPEGTATLRPFTEQRDSPSASPWPQPWSTSQILPAGDKECKLHPRLSQPPVIHGCPQPCSSGLF